MITGELLGGEGFRAATTDLRTVVAARCGVVVPTEQYDSRYDRTSSESHVTISGDDALHVCPDCDGDPTHPGVAPCFDCGTVCVHDRGCSESPYFNEEESHV